MDSQITKLEKPFVIRELRAELEQGELHFHYVLARPDGIRRETLRNPLLRGISLEGEVLAVRGEEVQLRLEIDKDDGLAEPHWYPFAPPTGSGMYCLPQVGTKASLVLPGRRPGRERSSSVQCARMAAIVPRPETRIRGTSEPSMAVS